MLKNDSVSHNKNQIIISEKFLLIFKHFKCQVDIGIISKMIVYNEYRLEIVWFT